MLAILWFIGLFFASLALIRKPHLLPVAVLALWCGVPPVANVTLTGTLAHPGAFFSFAAVVALLVARPQWLKFGFTRNAVSIVALGTLSAAAVIITFTNAGTSATLSFLATTGSAILLYITVRSVAAAGNETIEKVARGVVAIGACASVIAVLQFITNDVLFWGEVRNASYWFRGDGSRPMATLDSPLDLSMLCVVALPLVEQIKSLRWRWGAVALLITGVLVSQSRTAVLLSFAAVAFLLLRSRMTFSARLFTVVMVATVMGFLLFIPNRLTAGVQRRFETSTLSTEARENAFAAFWEHVDSAGRGYGASGWFRASGVTATSLENGYLMFAFDFGLLMAAFFLFIILAVLFTGAMKKALPGTTVSLVLAAIFAAAYSGIGNQGPGVSILYMSMALAIPVSRIGSLGVRLSDSDNRDLARETH